MKSIEDIAIILECTLINSENPSYIEISHQQETIYILLSKPEYKYYPLGERINSIFDLLKFEHSDILEQHPVIIETLDEQELEDLFRFYGK